jgi:hypothetical protein
LGAAPGEYDEESSHRADRTLTTELAYKLVCNEWKLPNMLQVIFGAWVEFLCYAAHHSTTVSHRKQLSEGGDFLTVIRLVVDHYEPFLKAEIDRLVPERLAPEKPPLEI